MALGQWPGLAFAMIFGVGCGSSSSQEDAGPPTIEEGDASFPSRDSAIDTPDTSADAQLDASTPDDAASDTSEASDASSDVTSPPPVLTPGAADRILLLGTVVTPDTAFDGQVLVEGALITCAEPGTACASKPGANGATIVDTQGVIAPGLIDMHNHILFDIFDDDDWLPLQAYKNHTQWTNETRYAAMLDVKQCLEDASQGKPTWCPATYDGAGSLKCEMDKWGELKGMIAGTTSIVGLAGTTSACFGSLARSIDAAQNDLGTDKIQTSAIFPPSKSSADGVCNNFTALKTDAYLVHCGEGVDAPALGELATLGSVSTTSGCLYAPQTVITHGTAFGVPEFTQMGQHGMKLTWSPKSNVALYGTTTNIPAALDANVLVSLGPDWSMGGSQNMLDEMRFAAAWDDQHFGDRLSAKDIVLMATTNAATSLGLAERIGSIKAGLSADLMVVGRSSADAYASIVNARAKDVRVTMVGGQILYGDAALQPAAPQAPGCETIDVCGASKFVCVAETSAATKLNQTYAQIKAALEAAMTDVDSVTPNDGFNFAPLAPLVKCN